MQDKVDILIDRLEDMIRAQDDIWNETNNCNYHFVEKLRKDRLIPAKQAVKDALRDAVKEILSDENIRA